MPSAHVFGPLGDIRILKNAFEFKSVCLSRPPRPVANILCRLPPHPGGRQQMTGLAYALRLATDIEAALTCGSQ